MSFERELRDLSWVPRWGIARLIRGQSVAEHSYYVAMYAIEIADIIEWGDSWGKYALVRYALWHDVHECFTSDIPGPVKRLFERSKFKDTIDAGMLDRFGESNGTWDYPCDELKSIVKTANLLDECMFLCGEIQMGNQSLWGFMTVSQDRLYESIDSLPIRGNQRRIDLINAMGDAIFKERSTISTLPPGHDRHTDLDGTNG